MKHFLLIFLLGFTLAQAQTRFLIRVFDNNNAALEATVTSIPGTNVVRVLDLPSISFNGLAVIVDNGSVGQLRNTLNAQYLGNFRFVPDPLVSPNEGSGDPLGATISPSPAAVNPALDALVPSRPITSPISGSITGSIIVDIVGTGVDQSHPDLSGLTFEPHLSVIFADSGGFLPANIDYHNHETRLAGCLAGSNTGLLTALGTRTGATYRSVLCYDKPSMLIPSVPTTYTTDVIAALSEVLFAHETRLATPYLHEHAAVMCFSHSVETLNTRVGDLDALFDLAWERGIITSISAGNHGSTAAASSPAGAGESITYNKGGDIVSEPYWPPLGAVSYALPATVGFEITGIGSDYHLKSGAHDNSPSFAAWDLGGGIGTALNTPNPIGFGPPMNGGVDLFAPGENIKVPASRLDPATGAGPVTVDGSTYYLEQGYQTGAGTSYSAAYTAALATRILQLRPWASPAQVRSAIIGMSGPFNIMEIPDLNALDPMTLSYLDWIARYEQIASFGYFSAGMDAKLADPDGDGVVNFIEYFCGMDPRFADPQHGPKVTLNPDSLTFTVEMQIAAYLPDPAEVSWEFQSSNDLDTWTGEGQGTITTASHLPSNGDGVNLTGTHHFTIADAKKFFRLSFTSTP